ncbi:MAG: 4a-hydroxytetrahydrobiopterin dehydratase [Bacteroidetes bacterium]|nr:4a-hydroxytetrahydrobiopterin dehydratase [Bacteroidota bacterium]
MWTNGNNRLTRTFVFADFVEAFGFMTQVALLAEKCDHHPTWSNTYNRVTIELSTHDAGNIVTEKDHVLARQIDQILNRKPKSKT